ncbi:MAG: UDP-N-acetylmuramoyl-L-alanine--D-glutamate ligase [Bacteroidales bacterium]|nr:UDP-N-acetylmuramoyl-L-alanine--D-glutamate ligase [Bacteroidales bacterium]
MQNKVVILGAGESGVGAAILAKKQNFDVFVSDFSEIKGHYKDDLLKNDIAFEEKQHSEGIILQANEIIKSPGIPDTVSILQKAKAKNIPVVSEIEFAARYTKAKMICITGSNGKTTTTILTYEIFKNAGLSVGLAGNVGESFAKQVAYDDFEYYILELSSFQLDNMYDFKADTAVLLNITPDHMDRYDNNFLKYVESKLKITQNQTQNDYFIYNTDDEAITTNINKNMKAKKYPFSIKVDVEQGAYLEDEKIAFNTNETYFEIMAKDISLVGKHNIYNSMAAALAAKVNHIKDPIIRKTLSTFKGVEHRLELFQTIRGIKFINDSKATNVNSVWYALEAIETPIVLIMGGTDKGNDYTIIKKLIRTKVKAIVALGVDNTKIQQNFKDIVPIIESKSMDNAVLEAYKLADEGETVLLSPACASFDLFENYIDRGQKFKEAVRKL